MTSRHKLNLRGYQQRAIAEIRAAYADGFRCVLLQSPTGSGKTIIFAFVAMSVEKRGKRVIICGHRQEIVEQISDALRSMSVPHGLIVAGTEISEAPVQVASIATLVRRLGETDFGDVDLLVLDEAHHAIADGWQQVVSAFPKARVLGVTATPERLDGRGLGDVFDAMVVGPDIAELTGAGFLVPATVYAPPATVNLANVKTQAGDYVRSKLAALMSERHILGDAVEHYRKICPGVPAVAFCCNIEHSLETAARFGEGGFRSAHIDGHCKPDERRALIAALGTGELDVLTNAGLISEGVDVPAIGAAIMLRPTKSLALYLQQVGRALRLNPGKQRAIILDHAGNVSRHGLPDAPRNWSLEGSPRLDRRGRTSATIRRCPECGVLNQLRAAACDACGIEFDAISELDIELQEVGGTEALRERVRSLTYPDLLQWADTEEKMVFAVMARGYKPEWIRYRLRERQG